jgi:hypothetical protein
MEDFPFLSARVRVNIRKIGKDEIVGGIRVGKKLHCRGKAYVTLKRSDRPDDDP